MSDTLADWGPGLVSADQANEKIWQFVSPINRDRYKLHYGRLERLFAAKPKVTGKAAKVWQGRRSNLIGKMFERLIKILFEKGGAVEFDSRVRTTTNEIDVLLKVQPLVTVKFPLPIFARFGTHLIGEAKCHAKAPGSELINEFVGVLRNHSATYGILFVFCPPRKIATDCRNAISLSSVGGYSIIPIGRKQLEQVRDGAPFWKVLSSQDVEARIHSNRLEV